MRECDESRHVAAGGSDPELRNDAGDSAGSAPRAVPPDVDANPALAADPPEAAENRDYSEADPVVDGVASEDVVQAVAEFVDDLVEDVGDTDD